MARFPTRFLYKSKCNVNCPTTPTINYRFRLFRFRSPLLTESSFLSLPSGTEMFHFPEFTPRSAAVRYDSYQVPPFGHPRLISLVGSSSWLFAAYYVLLRLSSPRHPLCALSSLTFFAVLSNILLSLICLFNCLVSNL